MRASSALLLVVTLAASGCTLLELPPTPTTTPNGTPTSMQSAGVPCADLKLAIDRDVLSPGENVSVALTLTNCGTTLLPVRDPGPCDRQAGLKIQLDAWGESYSITEDDNESLARPPFFHGPLCIANDDGPMRALLPAGASRTATFSWNGTLARLAWDVHEGDPPALGFRASTVRSERARPGNVTLSAAYLPENGTLAEASAALRVIGPERNATHVLLVREWDWRNGTTDARPRDMPTRDQAVLANGTLVVQGILLDDYGLVRVFDNGTTAFASWPPAGGWLASPWNASAPLLNALPSGDVVFVNDTRLPVGATRTLHVPTDDSEHVLVVTNVGDVPARVEASD